MIKFSRSADRKIVVLIALGQLALSSLVLFMEFGIAYGGGFRPLLTPYFLSGFINAWFLFSARPGPRVVAFCWQIIFAAMILIRPGSMDNPTDRGFLVFALLTIVAAAYLGTSTLNPVLRERYRSSPTGPADEQPGPGH